MLHYYIAHHIHPNNCVISASFEALSIVVDRLLYHPLSFLLSMVIAQPFYLWYIELWLLCSFVRSSPGKDALHHFSIYTS